MIYLKHGLQKNKTKFRQVKLNIKLKIIQFELNLLSAYNVLVIILSTGVTDRT